MLLFNLALLYHTMQWTYQAMMHDVIGIEHGAITLTENALIPAESRSHNCIAANDSFFADNLDTPYGEVGE